MINKIKTKGNSFVVDGEKVQLTGNHTWDVVQGFNGKRTSLDDLTGNFTRLWTIETKGYRADNKFYGSNTVGVGTTEFVPWKKNGELNNKFYDRFEKIVKRANKRDIVSGVCLFDNAFNAYVEEGWNRHPLNGLGPSDPSEVHSKGPWNVYQRAHVKRLVKTLEPYGNVIYEVGNELHRNSVPWFQKKVIQWVKKWTDKPVGASYASRVKPSAGRTQDWLTRVDADWIAPAGVEKISGFRGPQVFDTDHTSALTTNVPGLQRAWNEGRSVWLMDGMSGNIFRNRDNLQPDRNFISSVLTG